MTTALQMRVATQEPRIPAAQIQAAQIQAAQTQAARIQAARTQAARIQAAQIPVARTQVAQTQAIPTLAPVARRTPIARREKSGASKVRAWSATTLACSATSRARLGGRPTCATVARPANVPPPTSARVMPSARVEALALRASFAGTGVRTTIRVAASETRA